MSFVTEGASRAPAPQSHSSPAEVSCCVCRDWTPGLLLGSWWGACRAGSGPSPPICEESPQGVKREKPSKGRKEGPRDSNQWA